MLMHTARHCFHRSAARVVTVPRWIVPGLIAMMLGGCASNQPAVEETTVDTTAVASAPEPVTTGPTIGERLGRLDAQMKTAPPDSIPILRAEYQQLLAESRNGEQPLDSALQPSSSADTSEEFFRIADTAYPDTVVHTPPRKQIVTGPAQPSVDTAAMALSPAAIANPALVFNGLRPAELRTAPGYHPPSRHRAHATRRSTRSVRPSVTQRPRTKAEEQGLTRLSDRRMVEGMVAARAGRYAEAVEKFSGVSSVDRTDEADFYYALSLERTGELQAAASEYRTLSRGSSELAHRSVVAYARVLSQMGQTSRAKKTLWQFINANPNSPMVPSARELLQQI